MARGRSRKRLLKDAGIELDSIFLGDCMDLLERIPDGTVDLIVSSTGSVLSVSPKGASSALAKCIHPIAKKASFPGGGTRPVQVKVKL